MTNLERVLSLANGKGGVGKTSCSANIAGLSAAAGWRTLLIELDGQGNVGRDLGYTYSSSASGDGGEHLATTLMVGAQLRPVLTDVRPNLDVIPGGNHLDDLDAVIAARENRNPGSGAVMLRDALQEIAPDYDLIILDTPPARRQPAMVIALGAARWIVIPTKPDRGSIADGLGVLGQQIDAARLGVNPVVEVLGAVLFDVGTASTVIRANAAEDIESALGGAAPLFESVIRHSEQVAVASREKGKLVHELAEAVKDAEPYWKALQEGRRPERLPGSAPALAEDYVLLTQEILARIDSLERAGHAVPTGGVPVS